MKQFWCIVIGVIIGFGICYLLDRGQSNELPDMDIVRIDTLSITDTFYKPVPIPKEVIKQLPPAVIDTAMVIADYYARKIYNDTLINTDMLMVSVTDTVHENALLARKINYTYSYPQITKTTKNRLYMGADSRGVTWVGWSHKNIVLSAGYDIFNNKPTLGFGVKLFER